MRVALPTRRCARRGRRWPRRVPVAWLATICAASGVDEGLLRARRACAPSTGKRSTRVTAVPSIRRPQGAGRQGPEPAAAGAVRLPRSRPDRGVRAAARAPRLPCEVGREEVRLAHLGGPAQPRRRCSAREPVHSSQSRPPAIPVRLAREDRHEGGRGRCAGVRSVRTVAHRPASAWLLPFLARPRVEAASKATRTAQTDELLRRPDRQRLPSRRRSLVPGGVGSPPDGEVSGRVHGSFPENASVRAVVTTLRDRTLDEQVVGEAPIDESGSYRLAFDPPSRPDEVRRTRRLSVRLYAPSGELIGESAPVLSPRCADADRRAPVPRQSGSARSTRSSSVTWRRAS